MKSEAAVSAVLTLAAVVIAGVLVRREFFPAPRPVDPIVRRAEYVPTWREIQRVGHSNRDTGQIAVSVVVFDDLECPACRQFQIVRDSAARVFGSDVSFVFAHYPLPMHRFANAAAVAAECAGEHGRFESMVSAIFEKQDSIGLRTWSQFAADANVPDTTAFVACTRLPTIQRRVDQSREFGSRASVGFTPTVMINGWRLSYVPTFGQLDFLVRRFRQGRIPFDGNGDLILN
jgi:Thioredoxin